MQYTLRELRARYNISQSEMANLLNISVQTWNAWEQNPKMIRLGYFLKIADILKVNLNEIKVN